MLPASGSSCVCRLGSCADRVLRYVSWPSYHISEIANAKYIGVKKETKTYKFKHELSPDLGFPTISQGGDLGHISILWYTLQPHGLLCEALYV